MREIGQLDSQIITIDKYKYILLWLRSLKYKYKYNGQEYQDELGLNMTAMDYRLYDNALGRFMNIDPLADLPSQLDLSPYSFGWNAPTIFDDPTGLCPECDENVKNPTEGQTYTSTGGGVYTYNNGQWTRQDGQLAEIVVTNEPSSSTSSGSSDTGTAGKIARTGADFVPFLGSGLDIYEGFRDGNMLQLGMGIGFLALDFATLGSSSLIKGGAKTLGKELLSEGAEFAVKEAAETSLFHYTSEAGYKAIMESGQLLPSIGVKNARDGPGKYLTDIAPGTFTMGQTSRRLFGVPWNKSKLTHFIQIDSKTLNVVKNAPHNYMVPGVNSLPLDGIIMNHGKSVFK